MNKVLIQDVSPNKLKYNTGQIEGVPKNPRFIKDDKFKKLVKSLLDNPEMMLLREVVAVDTGKDLVVVAGNMRTRAAIEIGMKDIPVKIIPKDWTPEQIRAFIIKDNLPFGEDDFDLLANEWDETELEGWGYEFPAGFGDEKEVEEDEAPEVDETQPAKSVLGEVYKLGRHRLMCGDSVSIDDVGKLMEDKLADCVFTDPPWNVNYGAVKPGNKQGYKVRTIENDNQGDDFTAWMNDVFSTMNMYSKDGCMTYIVMSAQEWGGLMTTLKDNDYHWSSTIIWNKDHLVLSRKDYHTKYEPIWYGWKGEGRLHPLIDRKQSDVWDIDRPTKSEEHPTMKPIELCARAINNSSNRNDLVMDLFLGSGSTLIACEQTDRVCYGMELDPKYTDVIRKRWAKLVYPDRWELEWENLTPVVAI